MGSFNETCALSNLNISPGTKIKLLFLTRNPYAVNSDQKFAQRGCYHYDQWFVRTPPISGTYDDYGRCDFKESPIADLITECFRKDVIELPFGFNQYHACDVTKTKGIDHFIEAAWQGRLLVQDTEKKTPVLAHWPTWEKVHALLREQNLPIQLDSDEKEGQAGYNAQPVYPGIVCLTFNSYDDNSKKLKKAAKVLEKVYSTHQGSLHTQFYLMVAPRGAYGGATILHDDEKIKSLLYECPRYRREEHQLPVLAVMIHEGVWQAYLKVLVPPITWRKDSPITTDDFHKKLKTICVKFQKDAKEQEKLLEKLTAGKINKFHFGNMEIGFQSILFRIPFMTMPAEHIKVSLEKGDAPEELLQSCAELARIEYIMSRLHHSWSIPSLGGQEGEWELRTNLLKAITAVSKKEWKKAEADN